MPKLSPGRVRRSVLCVAIVGGVAVLLRLVYAPYLNYDARYSLLWAHDLWQGMRPDYGADFAPTPHPLMTAVSSIALPFGNDGDTLIVWLVLIAFGVLVWLAYRLGSELFSPWVGAVTALVVLTRPALVHDAVLSYQDVPFAALIVGAVLLEAKRPRRGIAVLVLLALAGLMRPEAWALSAAYAVYIWPGTAPRGRALVCALVATAPVLWALSDLIIAKDALHSLHGTSALAKQVGRRRHVYQVPYWTAKYFGYTLREPLAIGVPIGLVFAWLYRRREAALPFATAAAMTAVFGVGPVFGLPLIGRYIRTPAVLLALFYGLAVFGWLLLPPGPARRRWLMAGIVAVAASLVFLPSEARMLDHLRTRIDRDGKLYSDLERVGESAMVRASFSRCRPVSAADHRPIPFLRYWLNGPPSSVTTVEDGASPPGPLFLAPRDTRLVRRFYRQNFPTARPPSGYRPLYANRSWLVYARPGCLSRGRA